MSDHYNYMWCQKLLLTIKRQMSEVTFLRIRRTDIT